MGRPLNKKFFGNTNLQDFGTAGVGGESVASVSAPAGDLAGLVTGTFTIPAGSIDAPQITGGAKPVLEVVVTGATAYTVTVVSAGSGYTSAPTITFNGSIAGGTGSATPVATLTSGAAARQNAIRFEAQVGAGTEVTTGDIIKQAGSRRYRVQTIDGIAVCQLVTTADLNANEMSITATDSASGTYFVRKLTSRKAVLVQGSGTQFATGQSVKWSFGDAVANSSVKLDNQ